MLHILKFLEILDISSNPIKVIPKNLDEVQKLTNLYMNNTELTELTNQKYVIISYYTIIYRVSHKSFGYV